MMDQTPGDMFGTDVAVPAVPLHLRALLVMISPVIRQ
jgi:hypothetical protein